MKLTLRKKVQIANNVFSFFFEPEEKFHFLSGQYLRYRLPNPSPDERGINRFFSIASAPSEEFIQLTTKFDFKNGSSFKKDLFELNNGDTVEAFGPNGDFSFREGVENYVFIAGGIGITPFRSIIKDLDEKNLKLKIDLFYANRNNEIVFKDELENMTKKNSQFRIHYFITNLLDFSKETLENISVKQGRVNKGAIEGVLRNRENTLFYISGPETMVYFFEDVLKELEIPRSNIVCDYYIGYSQY